MKNLIALLTLSTFLCFASCTKEAIIQPETEAVTNVEMVNQVTAETKMTIPLVGISNAQGEGIDVSVSSHNSSFNELNIDFTSNHDFTESNLAGTQTIDFTDGSGNTVTLTFEVNSYTGGNGTLDINLAIGGNNLTGLGMKTAQIVIEDIIID